MRITLVVPSLRCGGTERVVAAMANYWAKEGQEITVLTCDAETIEPFYPLAENVHHRALNILGESANIFAGLFNNLARLLTLRSTIKLTTPNIIISFLVKNNVRVLLATTGIGVPVIVSERSDPAIASLQGVWKFLFAQTYKWAARVTVFTEHAANSFPLQWQQKIRVIPNPIAEIQPKANLQETNYCITGIGRLEEEKGFDLLIRAFALVVEKIPNATLKIWGEGSQKDKLRLLAEGLKVEKSVIFCGVTRNINQVLSDSAIFVQASRCEGFGNALCEAMAAGLPVISTACSGPQEIIRHNIDGILVPVGDVPALAVAMMDLLLDEKKRQQLSQSALQVSERFSLAQIMHQWDNLIAEIVQ